jgi:hypothetical protein
MMAENLPKPADWEFGAGKAKRKPHGQRKGLRYRGSILHLRSVPRYETTSERTDRTANLVRI